MLSELNKSTVPTLSLLSSSNITNVHIWMLSILLLSVTSCSKESPSIIDQVGRFEILSSHELTVANGVSKVKIRLVIHGPQGEYLPADDIIILQNGNPVAKNVRYYEFSTSEQGEYTFQAQIENLKSNILHVFARPNKVYSKVEIPLIFHIPEGIEDNKATEILTKWMESVNINFNNPKPRENSANSTSTSMYFVLATKDPQGNLLSEPGVNRMPASRKQRNDDWEEWMWDFYWDPDYYMNVWIGDFTSNAAGIGTYPQLPSDAPYIPYFGTNDSDHPDRWQGSMLKIQSLINIKEGWLDHVLEHELGHNLGLYHLHPCTSIGDAVDDTQQYSDIPGTTCDGNQLFSENFMSYERFASHFTYSQNERMQHIIKYGRWRAQKGMTTFSDRGIPPFKLDPGTPRNIVRPLRTKIPLYDY